MIVIKGDISVQHSSKATITLDPLFTPSVSLFLLTRLPGPSSSSSCAPCPVRCRRSLVALIPHVSLPRTAAMSTGQRILATGLSKQVCFDTVSSLETCRRNPWLRCLFRCLWKTIVETETDLQTVFCNNREVMPRTIHSVSLQRTPLQ